MILVLRVCSMKSHRSCSIGTAAHSECCGNLLGRLSMLVTVPRTFGFSFLQHLSVRFMNVCCLVSAFRLPLSNVILSFDETLEYLRVSNKTRKRRHHNVGNVSDENLLVVFWSLQACRVKNEWDSLMTGSNVLVIRTRHSKVKVGRVYLVDTLKNGVAPTLTIKWCCCASVLVVS